jgi:hypothetical protein
MKTQICFAGLAFISILTQAVAQDHDLVPLEYNHPRMAVDLGVGLWAWPLPMDYDEDGDLDLVVSCPDKPSNGTYFFENASGGEFPVFKAAKKIGPGHRNIRVSYVNGEPRVLAPGVEYTDFRKSQFSKPKKLGVPSNVHTPGHKIRANQWHYVDFDGDGDQDLVIGVGDWHDYGWDDAFNSRGEWTRGPLRGFLYLVRNEGSDAEPKYAKQTLIEADSRPIEVFGWPSPSVADFDKDGDLDILCGEFLDGFTYFENVGSREKPAYQSRGRVRQRDNNHLKMDLQMIVPVAIDWTGDGWLDLVCGDEDGRVALITNCGEQSQPIFQRPRYFQQEADKLKCGALATPFCIDWDLDGDEDILSGNTAGYVEFFENLGIPDGLSSPRWAKPIRLKAGGEVIRIQAGPSGSIQGPCEAKWGYTTFTVADWDHDGLADIVLNSIWGTVVWYRNEGIFPRDDSRERLPRLTRAQSITVDWNAALIPKPQWTWWKPDSQQLVTQWRTTPVVVDWNEDGINDLVMLDHEGFLALFERTKIVHLDPDSSLPADTKGRLVKFKIPGRLRPGKRVFVDPDGNPIQLNSRRAGGSGRRKLHAVDWDLDGDMDLLLNSVNADLFENIEQKDGKFVFVNRGPIGKRQISGHTSSPATCNFFGGEKRDLLVGAEDGLFYLLRR